MKPEDDFTGEYDEEYHNMLNEYRDRINPPSKMEIDEKKRLAEEKAEMEKEAETNRRSPIGRSIGIGISIDTSSQKEKKTSRGKSA